MSGKVIELTSQSGLSSDDVYRKREQDGKNIFQTGSSRRVIHIIWDIAKEPRLILLTIGCSLYFILGEANEGVMMLVAMILVGALSLYQEVRSSHALEALKQFTEA